MNEWTDSDSTFPYLSRIAAKSKINDSLSKSTFSKNFLMLSHTRRIDFLGIRFGCFLHTHTMNTLPIYHFLYHINYFIPCYSEPCRNKPYRVGWSPLSLKKEMMGCYSTPKDVQTSAISDTASTLITSM